MKRNEKYERNQRQIFNFAIKPQIHHLKRDKKKKLNKQTPYCGSNIFHGKIFK